MTTPTSTSIPSLLCKIQTPVSRRTILRLTILAAAPQLQVAVEQFPQTDAEWCF
ncbi:hypothetical protein [Bacteroides finegoldii]|uniref:hypothetical protein n=1 Tax=Bacteroides finegoldii TaxID=338188 RepID=UPI0022DEA30F|nr:hypothetical protein [Bacteroides finegoldii]